MFMEEACEEQATFKFKIIDVRIEQLISIRTAIVYFNCSNQ